jgi:ATP phosphoribosyltransferase regulatory subunit
MTDQLSGRMMGIRADITTQTALMDAYSLRREGPSRPCYAGTVLHARPRGPLQSRMPTSIGVELFGETSLSANIEVIDLFLQTLITSGVKHVYQDLGHADICRGLLSEVCLDAELEDQLFELLKRKAQAKLSEWIALNIQDASLSGWLSALPTLTGNTEVLNKAKELLKGSPKAVLDGIDQPEGIVGSIADKSTSVYIDLGEISGYHYHTGIVFAAYVQGFGKALGNDGRYDHVGEALGCSRSATGFAIDLKSLVSQGQSEVSSLEGIFAPYSTDRESQYQINSLRGQGKRVVQGFEGQRSDLH